MDASVVEALVLAAFGAWAGYYFAGRRWRQEERLSVYREHLMAAHRTEKSYRAFERKWDADPGVFPSAEYEQLMDHLDHLERTGQDVQLVAPWAVAGVASSLHISIWELLHEMVPDPVTYDYDFIAPPSYRWFKDRRDRFGWGPHGDSVDEFLNRARQDLGAQSRFWRVRGPSTTYRRAIPGWLRFEVAPRLPVVGRRINARQMRRFQEYEKEALAIPLRDPFTGEEIPRLDTDPSTES